MKPVIPLVGCALPGVVAAVAGLAIGMSGIAQGGAWAALLGGLSALWLIIPMGTGPVAHSARLGLAFMTRLIGAMVVAAVAVPGRADAIITLIVCLLAAMAVEMALLLRQMAQPQETARA